MATAKMLGKASLLARFAKVPAAIRDEIAPELKKEVDGLVAAQKVAAPVDPTLEARAGQFRDSIHAYETPDRELSYRIIADARDQHGEFIGPHIEAGHMAADGTHVEAKPSFFPTYRAWKKPAQRRLGAVARRAVTGHFAGTLSNG